VACSACGARAVGPPLVRPERELPGYGLAFAVGAWGALLCLIFLIGTTAALIERQPFSLAFWNIVAAAETAAWRLKFLALPLALGALWPSLRVLKTLHRAPARFTGLRLARTGFGLSAFVALAIAVLIGVTVPARLRHRAWAAEAKEDAIADETASVLLRYQISFGTYPMGADDLRARLSDPDGSVARVAELIKTGAFKYEPVSDIASLPTSVTKARARRNAVVHLRNATLHTDDAPDEGLSFTSYTLVLPGQDQKLGTADDITLRDGRIVPTPPIANNTSRINQSNSNTP